jgi:catechol 2,3-dioxygenase-like lactoylglutathione lyase family enzyme
MRNLALPFVVVLSACFTFGPSSAAPDKEKQSQNMDLGNFSVSLAVKDLAASRAFYEKLGFKVVGGAPAKRYQVLQNGTIKIGIFQGMFEANILTFNPGWDSNGKPVAKFKDVRDIQRDLEAKGLELKVRADEASTGPASFVLSDPDGNTILVDQHVNRP